MEIFHAFGIEWKLLVIQMINFAIALFVLYRYAYRPIMVMLAKREQEIKEGVEAAKAAKDAELVIKGEKEGILRSAREDGGKIVEGLRKQGIEEERRLLREAQEKSAALMDDSRKKAEEERAYILRESEKEVAKMAVLAAEKILRNSGKTA
jgi:F-type H+-transporting ATPase subunit b